MDIQACEKLLSDTRTYNKLTIEEKDQIIQEIIFTLQYLCTKYKNPMSSQEREFILSNISRFSIPVFYILAKVHKNPITGRPIVAGHSWLLTPASQLTGKYLQPFVKLYPTIIHDGKSLVIELEELKLPKIVP